MSLTFVQGDTAPAITAQILHVNDATAQNLTGCTVKFQMRKADDRRFTVNTSATLGVLLEGRVSYAWANNDLATPGDYLVQWEITFGDARIQTTAPETITVRRQ